MNFKIFIKILLLTMILSSCKLKPHRLEVAPSVSPKDNISINEVAVKFQWDLK